MSKLVSTFNYVFAGEYISERNEAEAEKLRAATGRDDSLPLDGGFELAKEIYSERIVTIAKASGIMLCRWSGVDLAIKNFRK